MVTCVCNPSTQEANAGESQVQDQPTLQSRAPGQPGFRNKTLSQKKKKKKYNLIVEHLPG
jgi:hypothetical protein